MLHNTLLQNDNGCRFFEGKLKIDGHDEHLYLSFPISNLLCTSQILAGYLITCVVDLSNFESQLVKKQKQTQNKCVVRVHYFLMSSRKINI